MAKSQHTIVMDKFYSSAHILQEVGVERKHMFETCLP